MQTHFALLAATAIATGIRNGANVQARDLAGGVETQSAGLNVRTAVTQTLDGRQLFTRHWSGDDTPSAPTARDVAPVFPGDDPEKKADSKKDPKTGAAPVFPGDDPKNTATMTAPKKDVAAVAPDGDPKIIMTPVEPKKDVAAVAPGGDPKVIMTPVEPKKDASCSNPCGDMKTMATPTEPETKPKSEDVTPGGGHGSLREVSLPTLQLLGNPAKQSFASPLSPVTASSGTPISIPASLTDDGKIVIDLPSLMNAMSDGAANGATPGLVIPAAALAPAEERSVPRYRQRAMPPTTHATYRRNHKLIDDDDDDPFSGSPMFIERGVGDMVKSLLEVKHFTHENAAKKSGARTVISARSAASAVMMAGAVAVCAFALL
ncbi:unnamed protein product [Tilletia controversa]|nr:unnamed protein product [Tilletia controversa]CAD6977316.1 unnamed protein product [Tilletia controversa]